MAAPVGGGRGPFRNARAVWVAFAQPPPGFVYTYTAPCAPFSPTARRGAPAAIVSPLTETLQPRASYAAVSDAVRPPPSLLSSRLRPPPHHNMRMPMSDASAMNPTSVTAMVETRMS